MKFRNIVAIFYWIGWFRNEIDELGDRKAFDEENPKDEDGKSLDFWCWFEVIDEKIDFWVAFNQVHAEKNLWIYKWKWLPCPLDQLNSRRSNPKNEKWEAWSSQKASSKLLNICSSWFDRANNKSIFGYYCSKIVWMWKYLTEKWFNPIWFFPAACAIVMVRNKCQNDDKSYSNWVTDSRISPQIFRFKNLLIFESCKAHKKSNEKTIEFYYHFECIIGLTFDF